MANFLIRGPVLSIGKRPWSAVIGCRNHKLFDYEGERRIYGFAVSAIFEIGFSVLVSVAVCRSCSISFSIFDQNKIEFSDLLFDAVWCFSGFSAENMRLEDFNHLHVFSGFA